MDGCPGLEDTIDTCFTQSNVETNICELKTLERTTDGFTSPAQTIKAYRHVQQSIRDLMTKLHHHHLVLYRFRALSVVIAKQLFDSAGETLIADMLENLTQMDSTALQYAGQDDVMRFPILCTLNSLLLFVQTSAGLPMELSFRPLKTAMQRESLYTCNQTAERKLRRIHSRFFCLRSMCFQVSEPSSINAKLLKCGKCGVASYCSKDWYLLAIYCI